MKPCDSNSYYESPKEPDCCQSALVYQLSNKYIPPRESGLYACISSRITTGIHVVRYHQINNN
uniref:Uncharacterized protein n=1 Tax=Daphnia magna TaxID=35525 RepID=A0A0P6IFQ9_9CRUS